MTELVVVIVLLGIISAVAMPRFANTDLIRDRGFKDDVVNLVRYAKKVAIASGCDMEVQFENTAKIVRLQHHDTDCRWSTGNADNSFTVAMPHPSSENHPVYGTDYVVESTTALTVPNVLVRFDKYGRPWQGQNQRTYLTASLNIAFGGCTLRIEPETGFAAYTASC